MPENSLGIQQIYYKTAIILFCKQCFHFLKLPFRSNFQKGNMKIDFPTLIQTLVDKAYMSIRKNILSCERS